MAWAPLLLTLLTHYTVSMVHAVLTQSPRVTASLGQKASLICTGNDNNVGYEGAVWLQQHPGKAPKAVMHRSNNRPSGISERFSGSRSGSVGTLSISGLLTDDEADYYCAAWDKSQSACTVLQVSGEVTHKP